MKAIKFLRDVICQTIVFTPGGKCSMNGLDAEFNAGDVLQVDSIEPIDPEEMGGDHMVDVMTEGKLHTLPVGCYEEGTLEYKSNQTTNVSERAKVVEQVARDYKEEMKEMELVDVIRKCLRLTKNIEYICKQSNEDTMIDNDVWKELVIKLLRIELSLLSLAEIKRWYITNPFETEEGQ